MTAELTVLQHHISITYPRSAVTLCLFPSRKSSSVKTYREGVNTSASAAAHVGSERQAETTDVTVPMMDQNHFIDAKVEYTNENLLNKMFCLIYFISFLVDIHT